MSHWFVLNYTTKILCIRVNVQETGFKFIGNTALALVEQGFEVPFGYEEAIGFMVGSEIRDKDGVSAAV